MESPRTPALDPRPPMTHDLKCHPAPFSAVLAGKKPFEWRKFDRDYRVGDVLNLREWDPEREAYTCIVCARRVTYMISSGFGIPEGYCIMGLEPALRAPVVPLAPAPRIVIRVLQVGEILQPGDLRDFGNGILSPTECVGEAVGSPSLYFRVEPAPKGDMPGKAQDGNALDGSAKRVTEPQASLIRGAADLAFELSADICHEHCDLDPDDQEKMAHCAWCEQATRVYQALKAALAASEAKPGEPLGEPEQSPVTPKLPIEGGQDHGT